MKMALFKRRNKNIGKHLRKKASEVSGKSLAPRATVFGIVGDTVGPRLTNRDVCHYFMKIGFDNKGDFQSYQYAKGSSKSVTLKIDAIALAAACAGVPVPDTPVFAEVGTSLSVKNTRNSLVAAYVAPKSLTVDGRTFNTIECGQIVFLAMTGYRWEMGADFSAELGVKTPEIPGLPSVGTGGGDYGGDEKKPTEVESGTYAELASFSVNIEAKASVQGKAGLSGQRLYLSDTVPSYIIKGGSNSSMAVIEKNLMSVLQHGSKKAYIKNDVKAFLKRHGRKQKRNLFQKLITGGDVSSAKLIRALEELQKAAKRVSSKQMCQHHIRALNDFKANNVLGPYNFVSLWGMKPSAEAGVSAQAEVSVKAGVGGVAGAGAGGIVELKGPSIATSLKFTRFRFQVAALARENDHPLFSKDSKLVGKRASSKLKNRHRALVDSLKMGHHSPSNSYAITTQDTSITYGQMDLTALELSAGIDIGAEQGLFSAKGLQTGKDGKKEYEKGVLALSAEGEAKIGLEETRVKGRASAGLKKALNFMRYESATAYWIPPAAQGQKKNEKTKIKLLPGSGFAFGQSVDVGKFAKHLQGALSNPRQKCGYMQALAGRLGLSYEQLVAFLTEHAELIGDIDHITGLSARERKQYESYMPTPSAFLIETSFEAPRLPAVGAAWSSKGRWVLGPGRVGKSLRGVLIPKGRISSQKLQAIRLRYRVADEMSNERTRFSLGIKYIAELGIEYKSVEEAGSEGIVNLATTWFNKFKRYNRGEQTTAYEKAVPQVMLMHQ